MRGERGKGGRGGGGGGLEAVASSDSAICTPATGPPSPFAPLPPRALSLLAPFALVAPSLFHARWPCPSPVCLRYYSVPPPASLPLTNAPFS